MRGWLFGTMFGLALGVAPHGLAGEAQTLAPAKPVWLTDYEAARETARRSGKPLFVVFR